jgi:hypothetical protein
MKDSARSSIVCLVIAGSMLVAGIITAPAAVIIYDGQQGTLPSAQGWGTQNLGTGTQSNPGDRLIVTDTDPGNLAFRYTNVVSSLVLNQGVNWQMRAHVRVLPDYGVPSGAARSLFTQYVSDGESTLGYGMTYTAGQTHVFLDDLGPFQTPVDIAGNPFLDIVLTKTNGASPGARIDDGLVLDVYSGNVLLGSRTNNYATLAIVFEGTMAQFGNFWGAPTGTVEVAWVTFGIGEAAPALVPEPSVIVLLALSAVVLYQKRRTA